LAVFGNPLSPGAGLFPEQLSLPLILLAATVTPPVLVLRVTGPLMVLPLQLVPLPVSTGPVELATVRGPVTVEPQMMIPADPEEAVNGR
jgi:hypothetical protein